MYETIVCIILWAASLILETTLFSITNWFHPNLLFLSACLFCLHWRGVEGYFIALFFGLTADCYSSLPFGIYGLTFFGLSFAIRWYSIKVFQPTLSSLPIAIGIMVLANNALILLILDTFFSVGEYSSWFEKVFFNEAIPTAAFSIVFMKFLLVLEKRYRIHLAERKF